MDEVELRQEGQQRRGHDDPRAARRPEHAGAAVDGQQRAQPQQRREDPQYVGGQYVARPRPRLARRVNHAVDVGQRRGVANPGERVEPDGRPRAGGVDGGDERRAEQVVEWWLGGFLPQPRVGRLCDARQPAGLGDGLSGEEVPVLVGCLEQRVQRAIGQRDDQIGQQHEQ